MAYIVGNYLVSNLKISPNKANMKILIVIDTLGSGGAQKLKVKLAKGLKKKGYEVEFFIYGSNYPFYESEVSRQELK